MTATGNLSTSGGGGRQSEGRRGTRCQRMRRFRLLATLVKELGGSAPDPVYPPTWLLDDEPTAG